MDSLHCDEVWLSSPKTPDYQTELNYAENYGHAAHAGSFYTTKVDCEQALSVFLEKELCYMPKPGYAEYLQSKNLSFARYRAIQWLIKSRIRLNLSVMTVFNAANYLDRFLSTNQSQEWNYWMVELLTVACLSVASKFSDTTTPTLQEIQMEELDHSFQSITIQRMELMLLQTLGWRLDSTTPYSYVELLTTMTINHDSFNSHLQRGFVTRITELLLTAMLNCKLVQYRPSIAAVSALWCCLEELLPSQVDAKLAQITGLFNQDDKDEFATCHDIVRTRLVSGPLRCNVVVGCGSCSCCGPSSPVTVLLKERIDIDDCHLDLSLFKIQKLDSNYKVESSNKKRKMEGK